MEGKGKYGVIYRFIINRTTEDRTVSATLKAWAANLYIRKSLIKTWESQSSCRRHHLWVDSKRIDNTALQNPV